jgi:hypothetical protein
MITSGEMDEEAKTAGDVTLGVGNGIATPSSSNPPLPQIPLLCPLLNPVLSIPPEILILTISQSSPPISV